MSHLIRLMASLALLLGGLSCTQKQEQLTLLKLAINAWPGYETLVLAESLGYFEEEGVILEVERYLSLDDALIAYNTGRMDLMAGTMIEALLSSERAEIPPKIILATDYSDGADMIIARKGLGSVKALRGKRVASETNALPIFILQRALDLNDMTLDDVEMVRMDQVNMEGALLKGEVDAVVCYPPVSSQILRKGGEIIFTSKEIPGEVLDIVFCRGNLLEEHPKEVAAILRAYQRALDYLEAEPEKARAMMAEQLRMEPAELKAVLEEELTLLPLSKQGPYFGRGGQLEKNLKHVTKVLQGMGMLERTPPAGQLVPDRLPLGER